MRKGRGYGRGVVSMCSMLALTLIVGACSRETGEREVKADPRAAS